MSDYISDQLRAKAAALRGSTSKPTFGQLLTAAGISAGRSPKALAEDKAARKAAAERAQAAALAEWEQLRARLPETPEGLTLRALLDEHKPYLDSSLAAVKGPACEHCDQIGGWEREGVEWPCANYEIIKEGMG